MCGGLSVTSCGSLQDLPGYWTHTTNRTRPHAQSTTFREHTCAEIKLHCGRAVPSAPLHAEAEVTIVAGGRREAAVGGLHARVPLHVHRLVHPVESPVSDERRLGRIRGARAVSGKRPREFAFGCQFPC